MLIEHGAQAEARASSATRRATSGSARPRFRGPNASSAATDEANSWWFGSWNADATWAASTRTPAFEVSRPSTTTVPSSRPQQAVDSRASVVLPDPLRPVIPTTCPALMSSETPTIAGGAPRP